MSNLIMKILACLLCVDLTFERSSRDGIVECINDLIVYAS